MERKLFPATNLLGQFFNDYLENGPVFEKYSPKGLISRHDEIASVIRIDDVLKGTLSINYSDGKIHRVSCETSCPAIISEMNECIGTDFQLMQQDGRIAMYVYEPYIYLSVTQYSEDCFEYVLTYY